MDDHGVAVPNSVTFGTTPISHRITELKRNSILVFRRRKTQARAETAVP